MHHRQSSFDRSRLGYLATERLRLAALLIQLALKFHLGMMAEEVGGFRGEQVSGGKKRSRHLGVYQTRFITSSRSTLCAT